MSQPEPKTAYDTVPRIVLHTEPVRPKPVRPSVQRYVLGPSHSSGNGLRNYGTSEGYIYQAALRSRDVKVNPFRVTWRLLRMSMYLAWFWIGVLWSRLRMIEADERSRRNARRFRGMIESLKGV